MTTRMTEGFDAYNGNGLAPGIQSRWETPGGVSGTGCLISLQAGRFGGQCLRIASDNNPTLYVQKTFYSAGTNTLTVGFAFRVDNVANMATNNWGVFQLWSGSTTQCGMTISSAGEIVGMRVASRSSWTDLGRSVAGVITSNTWHYIEAEIVVNDTTGRITVYVDDVMVLNLTGVDTKNSSTTDLVDTIILQPGAYPGGTLTSDFDDMYIIDVGTRLGESKIETLRPNADTAQKDWTPNSGTVNYDRINSTLMQTTNYVEAASPGLEDRYDFTGLSSSPASIHCVSLQALANKTDANTKQLKLSVDDGVGVTYGTEFSLSATINLSPQRLMDNKPSGGAWDAAAVNNMKAGILEYV